MRYIYSGSRSCAGDMPALMLNWRSRREVSRPCSPELVHGHPVAAEAIDKLCKENALFKQ